MWGNLEFSDLPKDKLVINLDIEPMTNQLGNGCSL